jgi:hypothetical protein
MSADCQLCSVVAADTTTGLSSVTWCASRHAPHVPIADRRPHTARRPCTRTHWHCALGRTRAPWSWALRSAAVSTVAQSREQRARAYSGLPGWGPAKQAAARRNRRTAWMLAFGADRRCARAQCIGQCGPQETHQPVIGPEAVHCRSNRPAARQHHQETHSPQRRRTRAGESTECFRHACPGAPSRRPCCDTPQPARPVCRRIRMRSCSGQLEHARTWPASPGRPASA